MKYLRFSSRIYEVFIPYGTYFFGSHLTYHRISRRNIGMILHRLKAELYELKSHVFISLSRVVDAHVIRNIIIQCYYSI